MSALDSPYGWRSSRSTQPRGTGAQAIALAEAQGRRPFFNQTGNIMGFASRPGAPVAAGDSIPNLGITVPYGQPGHDSAWDSFFGKRPQPVANQPAAVPTQSSQAQVDADTTFGGGVTSIPVSPSAPAPAPTSQNHILAAIDNHSAWLKGAGVAFPPPPTPRAALIPTTTNPMSFPTNDPARFKSAFVTPAGADPGYVAAVQTYNTNLYKPADTNQPAPYVPNNNWNRTGWNTPTAPIVPVNPYLQNSLPSKYGTGSVNFAGQVNKQPALPASTTNWGTNTAA